MEETKKTAAQRKTALKETAKNTVKKVEKAAEPVAKKVEKAVEPVAKKVEKAVEPVAKKVEEAAAPAAKAVKKETTKAAAKAKTAVKKTAAKAATKRTAKKEIEATVSVQFSGKSYTTQELVAIAKDVWKYDLKQKVSDFKSVELYVKPEENLAYYVINGEHTGSFFI
ncbi:MAG: DNA-binding protein [Lachnospiraceae bacterium]|nr:DNA-binding protein [Lachnospiraceae bacterium]